MSAWLVLALAGATGIARADWECPPRDEAWLEREAVAVFTGTVLRRDAIESPELWSFRVRVDEASRCECSEQEEVVMRYVDPEASITGPLIEPGQSYRFHVFRRASDGAYMIDPCAAPEARERMSAPAHGGCAHCAAGAGARDPDGCGWGLGVTALVAAARRCRRRVCQHAVPRRIRANRAPAHACGDREPSRG